MALMYVVTILLWLSRTRTAPFHSILASWTTMGLELMVKFLGWRKVAIRLITTFPLFFLVVIVKLPRL